MKTMKIMMLALLSMVAVISTSKAATAAAVDESPNGFDSPECTYGVDMLTDAAGWKLKFPPVDHRDAYKWMSLVTNGKATTNPKGGDIMVFDSWSGSSLGHVAWVSARDGDRVQVVHTNMKIGKTMFTDGPATYRIAWFRYKRGASSVKSEDNGKTYPLKGFITRK